MGRRVSLAFVAALTLLLSAAPDRLDAQRMQPSGLRASRPAVALRQQERESCAGRRLLAVPIGGALGALGGFLIFDVIPGASFEGALGAIYRNARRKTMISLGTLGLTGGLYYAFTMDCSRRRY